MKHTMKRLSAALLAAVLGLTLGACGGTDTDAGSTGTSTGESAGASSTGGSDGEVVTLKVWGFTNAAPNTEQIDAVAAAASEITREELGVEIEMTRNFDAEKANLAMASGEEWDLFNIHSFSGGVQALATNGYATPLNDLLAEYGKDILALQPEEIRAGSMIDGVLYAIPNNADSARAAGFAMNKAVLDELGIDPETIKTWDDVHDVLVQVKEARPDLYPLVPSWSNGGMQEVIPYHNFAGGAVLEDVFTDSTEVVNLYATDAYREFCERMYQWNQEGLIMPDASSSTEDSSAMVAAGKAFGMFTNTKPGIQGELEKKTMKEMLVFDLTPAYTTTSRIDILWYIAHNSEKPERGVQVLNEIYTNPELANICINGIEGTHFEIKDEEKGIVGFPEGVDGTTTGYPSYPWAWPNEMISYVWEGDPETIWTDTAAWNEAAIVSPAMGFTWDNSAVLNQVTACKNVEDKYKNALETGSIDPASALPEFLKELEDAGVNDIIAEKEAQFSAWRAEQG